MAYYEELNPILIKTIGEYFLKNQNLCKLLHYYPECAEDYSFDVYNQPDITNPISDIYMKNIFPMPKIPDAQTKKEAFLLVTFNGGYEPEYNKGFRSVELLIDIPVNLKVWHIKNGYRLYSIMHEVDKVLNNVLTDLPIENKPYLVGFQPRDYSFEFYGVQMRYRLTVNSNVICTTKREALW